MSFKLHELVAPFEKKKCRRNSFFWVLFVERKTCDYIHSKTRLNPYEGSISTQGHSQKWPGKSRDRHGSSRLERWIHHEERMLPLQRTPSVPSTHRKLLTLTLPPAPGNPTPSSGFHESCEQKAHRHNHTFKEIFLKSGNRFVSTCS